MNHSGSDALKAVTVSAVTATLINTFDASPYEWSATWFGYFNVSALNPLVYFGMTDGSCVPFLISDISQCCLSTRTVVGKTITGWMKGHALFCHLYLFYHYDGIWWRWRSERCCLLCIKVQRTSNSQCSIDECSQRHVFPSEVNRIRRRTWRHIPANMFFLCRHVTIRRCTWTPDEMC